MTGYLVRRLIMVAVSVVGVTILVFLFLRLQPGSPADTICAGKCSPQQFHELEHAMGLDKGLVPAYLTWTGNLLHGDFGTSLLQHTAIGHDLRQTMPVTAELGILGILIGLLIAVPVGVASAVYQDKAVDYAARSLAVAMIAFPSFWLAMLLITAGSKWKFWTPQLNYVDIWSNPVGNFKIMWLPALLLGVTLSGGVMRLTRTQMLEIIREDYIRTARAKGLNQRVVLLRHAIRNAALPIVTLVGLQVPIVIGGSVVLETLFSLPGVGRFTINGIRNGDYPIIQAVNLMVALVVICTNLIVDMLYFVIDPRLRTR